MVSMLTPTPEVEVTPLPESVSVPFSKVLSLINETVKLVELTVVPAVFVTLIGPLVTPAGAMAVIWVGLSTVKLAAGVPLNLTLLASLKNAPVMTTVVPLVPDVGVKELIVGGSGLTMTVKGPLLLGWLLTVTTTDAGPVAIAGTITGIEVSIQVPARIAGVPLKVTVLAPCEAPKFVPCTVTVEPAEPEFGETPLTFGAGTTVKLNPLLC